MVVSCLSVQPLFPIFECRVPIPPVFGIRILIHKVQLGFGFTTLKPNKNILAFFIYFFLVGLINTVNRYRIDYVIYYFTYSFYFQEEVFNLQ